MQTDLKSPLSKTQMRDIVIKEYDRLIDKAKEELKPIPGNGYVVSYYQALINEVFVLAVELGLVTETDKHRYMDEAEVELKKL